MSLTQRNGIWWIDIRTPGGKRIRRSAGTPHRKAAQEYHDRLKADLWRQAKLGDTPQYTFEQAAVRFLHEYESHKSYATHARHIAYWRTHLAGRVISSLTTNDIQDALPTHAVHKHQANRKTTPATRTRYLSTLRRMLNLCREWGWISNVPILRKEKEPSVRIRWITQTQAHRLLENFSRDWLRDMAWVTADKVKSGQARAVPLSAQAVAAVQRQRGIHPRRIFTRNGSPLKRLDTGMFNDACARADIENFRFHDLRHTWASWHVQAGTPLFVLKELGGWETLEMVKKYAHMDAGTLAQYANVVTFWTHGAEEDDTPSDSIALAA